MERDCGPSNACPLCGQNGRETALQLSWINMHEAVLMCPDPRCLYPLSTGFTENIIVQKNALEHAFHRKKVRLKKKARGSVSRGLSTSSSQSSLQSGSSLQSSSASDSLSGDPFADLDLSHMQHTLNDEDLSNTFEEILSELSSGVDSSSISGSCASSVFSSADDERNHVESGSLTSSEPSTSSSCIPDNAGDSSCVQHDGPPTLPQSVLPPLSQPDPREDESQDIHQNSTCNIDESLVTPGVTGKSVSTVVGVQNSESHPAPGTGEEVTAIDKRTSQLLPDLPQPCESSCHSLSSVGLPCDISNSFLQWKNVDNLCWLDVSMKLLMHCQPLLDLLDTLQDGETLKQLFNAYKESQMVLRKSLQLNRCLDLCKLGKTVRLETSVGQVVVQTGGGGCPARPTVETIDISQLEPSQTSNHTASVSVLSEEEVGRMAQQDGQRARHLLTDVRETVWRSLQSQLRNTRGQKDSPVFSLPLLLQPSHVKEAFTVKYTWRMVCSTCHHSHSDSVERVIPTFPNVPSDFSMAHPSFVRSCLKCNAPNQRMQMTIDQMPDAFFVHFVEGLHLNDITQYDFRRGLDDYAVKAVVQFKQRPNHFVAWIRNPVGMYQMLLDLWSCDVQDKPFAPSRACLRVFAENTWMECDDLKPSICRFSAIRPSLLPSQMHLVLWEKQQPGSGYVRPSPFLVAQPLVVLPSVYVPSSRPESARPMERLDRMREKFQRRRGALQLAPVTGLFGAVLPTATTVAAVRSPLTKPKISPAPSAATTTSTTSSSYSASVRALFRNPARPTGSGHKFSGYVPKNSTSGQSAATSQPDPSPGSSAKDAPTKAPGKRNANVTKLLEALSKSNVAAGKKSVSFAPSASQGASPSSRKRPAKPKPATSYKKPKKSPTKAPVKETGDVPTALSNTVFKLEISNPSYTKVITLQSPVAMRKSGYSGDQIPMANLDEIFQQLKNSLEEDPSLAACSQSSLPQPPPAHTHQAGPSSAPPIPMTSSAVLDPMQPPLMTNESLSSEAAALNSSVFPDFPDFFDALQLDNDLPDFSDLQW